MFIVYPVGQSIDKRGISCVPTFLPDSLLKSVLKALGATGIGSLIVIVYHHVQMIQSRAQHTGDCRHNPTFIRFYEITQWNGDE